MGLVISAYYRIKVIIIFSKKVLTSCVLEAKITSPTNVMLLNAITVYGYLAVLDIKSSDDNPSFLHRGNIFFACNCIQLIVVIDIGNW